MKTWSVATLAVSVRRGSTTITPPRAATWRMRRDGFGTCRKLHFETTGFAPTMTRHHTRSTSGNGCRRAKSAHLARDRELVRAVLVAEAYMLREPMPSMKPCAKIGCSTLKPAAVCDVHRDRVGVALAMTSFLTRAPMSASARPTTRARRPRRA